MSVKRWFSQHLPEILMGVGIAGNGVALVLAVKATPNAIDILKSKKEELGVDELDIPTTIKTAYKPYIPAAATALVSTGLLIASGRMHLSREIAATAATQVAMSALEDYTKKTIDIVGKEKADEIKQAVNQDFVDNELKVGQLYNITNLGGSTLCIDKLTGRIFHSDISIIREAECDMNNLIRNEGDGSLNDFYELLGLPPVYPFGDEFGWSWHRGGLSLDYSSCLLETMKPCLVIDYATMPYQEYDL